MRRLTEAERRVLKFVSNGEYLGFQHMASISQLEKKGLIEEVKTGFISQCLLRITPAGRAALAQEEK